MEMDTRSNATDYLQFDLGCAAYLVTRGFRLLGLTETERRRDGRVRYAFRFAGSNGAAEAAALDYLRGGSAPAKTLVDAEKALKTLLYGSRDGNGTGHDRKRRE
jgi:hypothetical protein